MFYKYMCIYLTLIPPSLCFLSSFSSDIYLFCFIYLYHSKKDPRSLTKKKKTTTNSEYGMNAEFQICFVATGFLFIKLLYHFFVIWTPKTKDKQSIFVTIQQYNKCTFAIQCELSNQLTQNEMCVRKGFSFISLYFWNYNMNAFILDKET